MFASELVCVCVCVCHTLSILREHELPDEFVCGLCVQRQGVAQRLQVRTLFQECLLQANATGVEVLLCNKYNAGNADG